MDPNLPGSGPPGDKPSNGTPPKYVPQFSAATQMILNRINSGAGASTFASMGVSETPPGYEDMKRNVMMGMKTSINMEMPSLPTNTGRRSAARNSVGSPSGAASAKLAGSPSAPASKTGTPSGTKGNLGGSKGSAKGSGRGKKGKSKAGSKRKRKDESSEDSEPSDSDAMSKLGGDSDSDGSGSITEFPKVTSSGRTIVKPTQFVPEVKDTPAKRRAPSRKAQEQALCKRCGRGHSPDTNQIVFCDGCNLGWHQQCHDPHISDEAVKDEDAPWFCADCTRKRASKGVTSAKASPAASTPPVEPPLVSWQGRPFEDRRAYLSTLSQPKLVDLLLQACAISPSLPLFPAQTYQSPNAQQMEISAHPPIYTNRATSISKTSGSFPPPINSTPNGLFARSESNPNAPMNFIRRIASGKGKSGLNPSKLLQTEDRSSAPPSLHNSGAPLPIDSRESTPASPPYPRPGHGLMAKLGPDDQDDEWMVDDNDFGAFTHTVYDDGMSR